MTSQLELSYGVTESIKFSLDDGLDVTHWTASGTPLADPAQAASEAVGSPVGYPPLANACVQGDHVVIAVDADVPEAHAVIRGVMAALLDGGQPIELSVLCASAEMADKLRPALDGVTVEAHDPNDPEQLAYLATLRDGRPVHIGRQLQEADVVIPIGALRPANSFGYAGVGGGLFPAFSDVATQAAFRAAGADSAELATLNSESAEAAWLLGIQFTVQVVPGANGGALEVLAGDCHQVEAAGRERCDAAWTFRPATRSSLVVAAVDGDDDQQTWDNFARALDAARRAAEDDADILICSALSREPGPALLELGGDLVDEELSRELRKRRSADVGVATLLFETLQNAHVYLMSGLPDGVVRALGLTPLQADDVEHIVGRHQHCTLIASAHRTATAADVPLEISDY